MTKLMIPIILVFTIMIAGVFAFVPIENASTVHETIMANSIRIDEITAATTTADEDLVITCPAASDSCRIIEIYLEDTDADGIDDIDIGALNAVINNVNVVIQADLNTQIDDTMEAIAGVSGATIGGGDTLTLVIVDGTSESEAYNAVIFIEVEGNTSATADFQ